ncbi:type IV toxin-antitoxin system YeeU family antitoxin [Escherichia coli]|nr:type IV toxin-antitoxin system YeeU family antitoxin [Escherichia coli]
MQQLSFLPGEMTPGERSLIQRALKTLDRHLHEPGVAFTSTRAAREWLILNMAGLEREEFRVLYLNNQNQLIAGETLFTGTINRTEVHPREVIKRALYHNAAAVVLAHNHPSGEVTPSKADRLITERLVQALGLVDIRGRFRDADAYPLDQAFPLLMKQLKLMLTSGELNPRHQHTVTLYAKGLTCEADTLGSCGYVYLAVYPTPETKK